MTPEGSPKLVLQPCLFATGHSGCFWRCWETLQRQFLTDRRPMGKTFQKGRHQWDVTASSGGTGILLNTSRYSAGCRLKYGYGSKLSTPNSWMVFLLNMIISVGHWYHHFEPNPFIRNEWFVVGIHTQGWTSTMNHDFIENPFRGLSAVILQNHQTLPMFLE